jgi:SHS2 domain-containing protein
MYKIIDHTADIGLEITGADLAGLFLSAAEGLVAVAVETNGRARLSFVDIRLSADDSEQLLVRWLRELVLMLEKGKVPSKFIIKDISPQNVSARVGFAPYSEEGHKFLHEIKAVTYHDLKITKSGGQLRATVIFDI